MMTRFLLWRLALIAVVCVLAKPASAQTCFQRVGGVPGAYNQPPDWWSGGAMPLGSVMATFIDDPRWQGATAFSHISDNGRFRALVETVGTARFFVLSWRVKADPSGNADRLYLGFWDEASNQGNVFRLEKGIGGTATPVAGETYAGGAFNGRFFNRSGTTGNTWALNNTTVPTTPPPLPDWLKNDTRVDVICPGGTCNEWAIRMRIPIDPAADVTSVNPTGVKITTGGVFRFWYQIQEETTVGTAVLYGWPEGLAVAQEGNPPCTSIPPNCFPDPLATTSWLRVQDGGTCTGDISITPGQIYANAPGSITVSLSTANNFHARPLNNTTSVQPGNAVKAKFRIANWGSALFSSPQWLTVCSDQAGTAGSINPTTGQFDIICNWTVPNPCDYKPTTEPCGLGTKNVDQCMLVELASGAGSGPYHFSPQSAWRNMLFNGASTLVKTAEIDLRGQQPLAVPAPNRDLYVYVDVRNMPAQRSPQAPPIDLEKLPGLAREKLAKLKIHLPQAGGIGKGVADAIAQAMGAGLLSLDEVSALMPTYTAHVWYDTGRTMIGSGGATLKILEAQPSYGLFVWHDGDLHGWRHRFEGSNITELAPNYYRISAPTDGNVKVTTTVVACERPDCGDTAPVPTPTPTPTPATPVSWWLLLLLVILALLIVFYLIRKNNASP